MKHFDLPSEFADVDQSSPEFNNALEAILDTKEDLFICGSAGTGKSLLARIAYKTLSGNTLVGASTGVAASNLMEEGLPAQTIHSLLRIPAHDIFDSRTMVDKTVKEVLRHTDTLIIDEISMVSSSLFDQINRIISRACKTSGHRVRMILFGDILQLPPVIKNDDVAVEEYYKDTYDGHTFFFSAKSWHYRDFRTIVLNRIYRQVSGSFQDTLDRIRLNVATEQDISLFDNCVCPLSEFLGKHKYSLVLAPSNARVKELNDMYGIPRDENGQPAQHRTYVAKIEGKFDPKEYSYINLEETIYLGGQVMCIKNNRQSGYINGTLGIVRELHPDSVVIEKQDGSMVEVGMAKWAQNLNEYNETSKIIDVKEIGSLTQIGCRMAKAVTIHKSQGLTLDNVYLDLKGCRWVPDSGVYIALSRCRALEGIGLSRKLSKFDIHVNREALDFVLEEWEKEKFMREHGYAKPVNGRLF